MTGIIWFFVFLIGALVLAYQRVSLLTATLAYGGALLIYAFTTAAPISTLLLVAVLAVLVLLNIDAFRLRFISRPFLRTYRRMLPSMSQTEKDALEAGTVWWDGELFTGGPDWDKLLSATPPRLTPEEQAFIDGPCEELCRMIDDWDITHRRADLPPHLWDYIKSKGFFTTAPTSSATTTCRASLAAKRFHASGSPARVPAPMRHRFPIPASCARVCTRAARSSACG